MLTSRHAICSALTVAAAAFAATAGATPGTAEARSSANCSARAHTLVKAPLGRVWRSGRSLYACTTVYGRRPRTVRLGPWAPGARVAFDGVNAAWAVPHRLAYGKLVDRAWAASAETGKRWLLGTPLVPAVGATPRREARAAWITVNDASVAWVTRTSDVVLALHEPSDMPTAIGTLPAPLTPAKKLLLVGSFTATPAAQLAASAKLEELTGDGDECGGANDYRLTVDAGTSGPVGALWNGYWTRPNCG